MTKPDPIRAKVRRYTFGGIFAPKWHVDLYDEYAIKSIAVAGDWLLADVMDLANKWVSEARAGRSTEAHCPLCGKSHRCIA